MLYCLPVDDEALARIEAKLDRLVALVDRWGPTLEQLEAAGDSKIVRLLAKKKSQAVISPSQDPPSLSPVLPPWANVISGGSTDAAP
jgi:hypothetical protein